MMVNSFQLSNSVNVIEVPIPKLAFGKTEARLIIGKKYSVPDEGGKEVVG